MICDCCGVERKCKRELDSADGEEVWICVGVDSCEEKGAAYLEVEELVDSLRLEGEAE